MAMTSMPVPGKETQRVLAATLIGGLLASALGAAEEDYEQLQFDRRAKTSNRITVAKILDGRLALKGNEGVLRAYFENCFAEMTQREALGNVADMRWQLCNQMRKSKSPAALSTMNQLAMKLAKDLCTGNYHPAARYNAALILGALDQELSTSYEKSPVPYPGAVPVLVELLSDDQMIDAVKVAALLGLKRHARYDMPASERGSVTELMLALLRAEAPPPGRSTEGHVWMRRRAADVLGQLGQIGKQSEVLEALVAVLSDENIVTSLRCAAADAVGSLKYGGNTKVDAGAIITQLGVLAVSVFEQEVALANKRLKQKTAADAVPAYGRSGQARLFRGSLAADDMLDEEQDEGVFPRRQLASRLRCVRNGLDAIKDQANPQAKALAAQIIKWLDNVHALMEQKERADAELIDEVARIQGDVEAAIRQPQPAAAPDEAKQPATEEQAHLKWRWQSLEGATIPSRPMAVSQNVAGSGAATSLTCPDAQFKESWPKHVQRRSGHAHGALPDRDPSHHLRSLAWRH